MNSRNYGQGMRYNCDEIIRILESADDLPVDIGKFENHLESCPGCRRLCDTDAEIEDILRLALPAAAPVNLADQVFARLREYEKKIGKIKQLERSIPLAMTIIFLALSDIMIEKWSDLKTMISGFSGFDFKAVITATGNLLGQIDMPEFDLFGIESLITGTPLILFTMISISAVIWTFSLIEFEKTL